jgi:PAS domain S-box-containing protein
VETAVEPILFGSTPAKLILVHDVSERIRAEEALRESEERFSKAFHASPVATTITKLKNGLFIDINESFLQMTGYERAEVIGRTSLDLDIWSTPEDRNDFLAHLKREGSVRDNERTMYTKQGEPLTILLSAEVIELGGEPCLLMRLQNITETKRNLEKIRTYQDQLRLLASQLTLAEERERRRIAVDLHDCIGQNLAMIKVKLGVLQKEIPEKYSAKIEPMRELIEETIRSTRSLSFQLSPPVLYELGLASAVEWLTENTQEQYGIQIDFQKDEQPIAVADPLKVLLFAIIRELLMNVVKHSSAQSARVSFGKSSNMLNVCVEDDGIGFDTASLSRPFGQSGGFGLFSIRERIANFGGRLDVRSKMGGGTKVTLTAPLETQEVQSEHQNLDRR